MLTAAQTERVLTIIRSLDREQVVRQLRTCRARFPVDFTPDWLDAQPIDELRHVFAALCLQCDIIPHAPDAPEPCCAA